VRASLLDGQFRVRVTAKRMQVGDRDEENTTDKRAEKPEWRRSATIRQMVQPAPSRQSAARTVADTALGALTRTKTAVPIAVAALTSEPTFERLPTAVLREALREASDRDHARQEQGNSRRGETRSTAPRKWPDSPRCPDSRASEGFLRNR
jgi:hypothetical protein